MYCGPQKLDQTYRLPELRERTPLPVGDHRPVPKSLPEFCRSQLCTVVHGPALCNGRDRKKQRKFKNLGVDYEPGGRGFKSCRARQNSRTWERKPSSPSCCGTVVGPLIHRSARRRLNSSTWPAKPGPPCLLWDPVGTLIHTSPLAVGDA